MMTVKQRREIEKRIIHSFVDEMIEHGYTIAVDNGEERTKPLHNTDSVMDMIMATDEDRLLVHEGSRSIGWAFFVYGNDGIDVLADYAVDLEPLMPKTLALIDSLA